MNKSPNSSHFNNYYATSQVKSGIFHRVMTDHKPTINPILYQDLQKMRKNRIF